MDVHRPVVNFKRTDQHTRALKKAYPTFEDALKTAIICWKCTLEVEWGCSLATLSEEC